MPLRSTLLSLIVGWLSPALLLAAASPVRADESGLEGHTGHWISLLGQSQREWKVETVLRPEPQASPSMLMFEVNRFPNRNPTRVEIFRARKLGQASFRAARANGWLDIEKARADGFEPFFGDPTHFVKNEYLRDEAVVNPNRPEYLMYYPDPENAGKKILVGVMYRVRKPLDHGPQIGGPMTLWHYHVWKEEVAYCVDEFYAIVGEKDAAGDCSAGDPAHYSPEMLHVWFVKHPRGPFSALMSLPPKTVDDANYEEMAGRILGEGGVLATPLERAEPTGEPETMEHHH